MALGRVTGSAERNPIDRHFAARTDAGVRRAKEDRYGAAVDGVVARVMHRPRSVRRRERHGAEGSAVEVVLLEVRQQVEKVSAERAAGRWVIADTGRKVLVRVMESVCGEAELPEVVGALDPVRRLPALCTAGTSRPMRMAMIAITTSSSISVNPRRAVVSEFASTAAPLSWSGFANGRALGPVGSDPRPSRSCLGFPRTAVGRRG